MVGKRFGQGGDRLIGKMVRYAIGAWIGTKEAPNGGLLVIDGLIFIGGARGALGLEGTEAVSFTGQVVVHYGYLGAQDIADALQGFF